MTWEPLPGPYVTGDVDVGAECPNCGVGPHQYCIRPDGHQRKTPCIARYRGYAKPALCQTHPTDASDTQQQLTLDTTTESDHT